MAERKEGNQLNDQQELFCQEYLKDMNMTKAAIRAGYSEKSAHTQGSRLLKNAEVAARVKELMKARVEKIGVDNNWVLLRFMQIADRCMQNEEVKEWDYTKKKFVGTGVYQFDSNGANKAIDAIAKHVGFYEQNLTRDRIVQVVVMPHENSSGSRPMVSDEEQINMKKDERYTDDREQD